MKLALGLVYEIDLDLFSWRQTFFLNCSSIFYYNDFFSRAPALKALNKKHKKVISFQSTSQFTQRVLQLGFAMIIQPITPIEFFAMANLTKSQLMYQNIQFRDWKKWKKYLNYLPRNSTRFFCSTVILEIDILLYFLSL